MKFFVPFLLLGSLTAAASVQKPINTYDDRARPVPGDNPLEYCETPDKDILTVKKVDLSPNPPQKGKELQITASGTLSEAVEEGAYVLLQVKLGILTLISANASLCEELDKVEKPCPLEKGELTFKRSVDLPAQIPPGKFFVHADVYSQNGDRITCMQAKNIQFPLNGNSVKNSFKNALEL